MLRKVWASDLTVKPSLFEPGSIPTAVGWTPKEDGAVFNLTQKTPFDQNGVAFPSLIHLLALDAFVGIKGFPSRITGTVRFCCCKPGPETRVCTSSRLTVAEAGGWRSTSGVL